MGNYNEGVYLENGSDNNTIGGSTQPAGNVISANGANSPDGYGIDLDSNNNNVDFNYLGRNAAGNDRPRYPQRKRDERGQTNGSVHNAGTGNTITTNNKLQLPPS